MAVRFVAVLLVGGVFALAAGAALDLAKAGIVSRLSPLGQEAEAPIVAVDAAGDRTAAWINQPAVGSAFVVMSATRPAHAPDWTVPVAISGRNAEPDSAQLAVGPNGAAVIAWVEERAGGRHHGYASVLVASYRTEADAPWQSPRQVSPGGQTVGQLALGIDGRGRPLVVWTVGYDLGGPIEADSGSSGGAWGTPQVLATHGSSGSVDEDSGLQLSVNDRGEALAVWQHEVSQHRVPSQLPFITYAVIAASRSADGRWQAPHRIGTATEQRQLEGGNIWAPPTQRLALDDRGGAVVIWNTLHGQTQALMDARRPPGGGWHAAAMLSAQPAYGPVVASDARGDHTATWLDPRGRILVTEGSPRGNWSPPRPLPGTTQSQTAWLSVNPRGDALIAWVSAHHPTRELVSFRAGPVGAWRRPSELGNGEFPDGALDPNGSATILWAQLITAHHSTYDVIEAAVRMLR